MQRFTGNISGLTTTINNAYVNNHQERIILATQRATPLFNHPFGLLYDDPSGFWHIQQLGTPTGSFASGVHFDTYAQDPSLNAFVWTTAAVSTAVLLDHPLLNDEPCGRVYATNGDASANAHPIAVRYSTGRRYISDADGGSIPASSPFNVIVDEAAIAFCRFDHIFHDGVDPH